MLTEGAKGMKGAIQKAEEIVASNPEIPAAATIQQSANPEIHEKTTGPEIWKIPTVRLMYLLLALNWRYADWRQPLH
ncbi:hypothetical protein ACLB1S_21945 [Escherichia coli]